MGKYPLSRCNRFFLQEKWVRITENFSDTGQDPKELYYNIFCIFIKYLLILKGLNYTWECHIPWNSKAFKYYSLFTYVKEPLLNKKLKELYKNTSCARYKYKISCIMWCPKNNKVKYFTIQPIFSSVKCFDISF